MVKEDRMNKKDFEGILEGLTEAVAHIRGEDVPGLVVHIPADMDTKAMRAKLGNLSQEAFAERFGFTAAAVRDWEQGRRMPDRAVRAYLKVISVAPDMVGLALTMPEGGMVAIGYEPAKGTRPRPAKAAKRRGRASSEARVGA